MIRHRDKMEFAEAENCHDGIGTLHLHTILTGGEGIPATFMHDDILDPGVTIGEHLHENSSEIYFVVEGDGIMIVDGKEHPISAGDVSWCSPGHSHGIINSSGKTMRLLVVGL